MVWCVVMWEGFGTLYRRNGVLGIHTYIPMGRCGKSGAYT
jgi:hypothetical protein